MEKLRAKQTCKLRFGGSVEPYSSHSHVQFVHRHCEVAQDLRIPRFLESLLQMLEVAMNDMIANVPQLRNRIMRRHLVVKRASVSGQFREEEPAGFAVRLLERPLLWASKSPSFCKFSRQVLRPRLNRNAAVENHGKYHPVNLRKAITYAWKLIRNRIPLAHALFVKVICGLKSELEERVPYLDAIIRIHDPILYLASDCRNNHG